VDDELRDDAASPRLPLATIRECSEERRDALSSVVFPKRSRASLAVSIRVSRGGWVAEMGGRVAGCTPPSKNPRPLSQLQAYIARWADFVLRQVHRGSIVSLLQSVGGWRLRFLLHAWAPEAEGVSGVTGGPEVAVTSVAIFAFCVKSSRAR
jgi:hypothetical protein